jgi:hypothetical protein|tara:strand:- start:22 stop:195 length:174 start_codon:yes stop_codon:yes gene_type:complete
MKVDDEKLDDAEVIKKFIIYATQYLHDELINMTDADTTETITEWLCTAKDAYIGGAR